MKDDREQRDGEDRLVIEQSHDRAAEKPRDPVSGIKKPKRRFSLTTNAHELTRVEARNVEVEVSITFNDLRFTAAKRVRHLG